MESFQFDDIAVADVAPYHPSSWQRQSQIRSQSPADEREELTSSKDTDQQPANLVVSPSVVSSSLSSPSSSFPSSPSESTLLSDVDDGNDHCYHLNENDDNIDHHQSSNYSVSVQRLTFEDLKHRLEQVHPNRFSSTSSWVESQRWIRRTTIAALFLLLVVVAVVFMATVTSCQTKRFPSTMQTLLSLSSVHSPVSDVIRGETNTLRSGSLPSEEGSVRRLDSDKVCKQSEVSNNSADTKVSGDTESQVVDRYYPIILKMVRTILTDALVGYRQQPSNLHQTLKNSCGPPSAQGQVTYRDNLERRTNNTDGKEKKKKNAAKNVRDDFNAAYGQEIVVSSDQQRQLLDRLADDLINNDVNDTTSETTGFLRRSSLVPWGGPSTSTPTSDSESYEWFSSQENGRNLLYGYLRLMKWPADLRTSLCRNHLQKHAQKQQQQQRLPRFDGSETCDAKTAIFHSLTFRENYKPWIVTKSMMISNSDGAMYHHGFSPSLHDIMDHHRDDSQFLPRSHGDNNRVSWPTLGHSLVWIRPALRIHVDDESTVRAAINILDRAVAASLQRSGGRVGKFNVVFDMKGLSWKSTPSMTCIKSALTILNNHYVDRLGIVLLVNMSHVSEVLLNLVRPLLSPEVRNKIVIVPSRDKKHREEVLSSVLGSHNIPTWLGGFDTYKFNLMNYYGDQNRV